MEKHLGQEYPVEKRKQFLADNCDHVEELGYMKHFSHDDMVRRKEDLTTIAININDLEEEKKEFMDAFKEKMKPLSKLKKEVLTDLKNKAEHVTEPCYKYIDHEEGQVGYYNQEGELVLQRPIHPDEKQSTIFQMMPKNGTHDE